MNGLPLFWPLRDRLVVVVGDGPAAVAKLALVAKTGARPLFVSRNPSPAARTLVEQARGRVIERRWAQADLRGAALVFGGDLDPAEAEKLSQAARRLGLPVNIVDQPALSDFFTPAIVDRGAVVVGISTGGNAPMLAQRLRLRIEACLPAGVGHLATFAGRFRQAVQHRFPDGAGRRRFWAAFFDSALAAEVMAGTGAQARRAMIRRVRRWSDGANRPRGITDLVIPSCDPQDMTLRDLARLCRADVIAYPVAAVNVADFGRRDAVKIELDGQKPMLGDCLPRHLDAGADVVRLVPASTDIAYAILPTYHGEVR